VFFTGLAVGILKTGVNLLCLTQIYCPETRNCIWSAQKLR